MTERVVVAGRRKKPQRGAGKPVPKPAVKFWVPPSVRDGGPKPAARAARGKKAAPKFWRPEDFGFEERKRPEAPESRTRVVHTVGGVRFSWTINNGRTPNGLTVEGLAIKGQAHERVTVIYPGNRIRYADPVLAQLDPYKPDGSGWCVSCNSDSCEGVRWALAKLHKKNRTPF